MTDNVVDLKSKVTKKTTPFVCGDAIVLKTGGSYMVVAEVDKEGLVVAEWHTDDGYPALGAYKPDMVMLTTDYEKLNR